MQSRKSRRFKSCSGRVNRVVRHLKNQEARFGDRFVDPWSGLFYVHIIDQYEVSCITFVIDSRTRRALTVSMMELRKYLYIGLWLPYLISTLTKSNMVVLYQELRLSYGFCFQDEY